MSTYELSHEHAERTTRLLYCLMRDDKFDIVSALEKINNGFEATAKRFYPVDPKRIGAQAFCMEALRWTSREYLTGVLSPRAGPSPFRYPYTDYIPRAVGLHLEPSPVAEGKRWFEGMNPHGYFAIIDEPENDRSPYYYEYYKRLKSIERWGDRAGMTHYIQEEDDISEIDTTAQTLTDNTAQESTEETAQKSTEKKKKKKNKKTEGGKGGRDEKAVMRMQENPDISETETTAQKVTEKKGKKTAGGKERREKKKAMRKKATGKNVTEKN